MKNLLKLELKKAFCNTWFAICLMIGTFLVCISACQTAIAYYGDDGVAALFEYRINNNIMLREGPEAVTLYNRWLGARSDLGAVVFFYLVPLLAVLPCGWNISVEINGGYLKAVVPRVGRKKYFSAKLLAAFISGGTAVASMMLLSLIVTAALVPAVKPHPYNNMYYWVYHGDLFSSVAFSHPLAYALIYVIIDFLFAGLFACLSLVVALYSERHIAALVIPYIVVILCDAAHNFLNYICYVEISPLNLMCSLPPLSAAKPYIVIGWFVLYLAVILVFGLRKGVKKEIA